MYQRSHSCGALRASHVGQTVQLAGWVNVYRDFGGLVFIDLRDREGITQIVFDSEQKEAHEIAAKLRNEDVITIEGVVRDRGVDGKGKSLNNPKLATGAIEVKGLKIQLLNKGNNPPFTPDDAEKVGEETRLKYRFIDLRRPRMQHILKTRHRVAKIIRDYFDQNGFLEIETPFLCKSTPEGARDFLVPSRLQPGAWYALPQSPQLFKQILMVAGYERYLQIVRCFRDEDPRADRQAEFTQVDLEMSFVEQEDVMKLVEGCIARIWKEVLNVDVPNPIRKMTYAEAMDKYGIDRPDLRFGLELHNISDLAAKVDFGVFKGALEAGGIIKAICVPGGATMTRKETDGLAEWSKGYGAKGLAVTKVTATGLDTGIAKFIAPIAGDLIQRLGAKEGDLICFAADSSRVVHKVLGELRLKLAKERGMIKEGDWQWVWVVDFPAVEWNPDEKRWDSLHHPFTAPLNEDLEKLASGDQAQISSVRSKAYDIVCNGSELGGGSIRIHRPDVQQLIFKLLGIGEEDQKVKFGFLLDALKFGAPPHGGLALGLDRVVMHLCNTTNIRDVIAFPKTQNGADLMLDAPGPVEEKQLRELHVRTHLPAAKPAPAPGTPPAQA